MFTLATNSNKLILRRTNSSSRMRMQKSPSAGITYMELMELALKFVKTCSNIIMGPQKLSGSIFIIKSCLYLLIKMEDINYLKNVCISGQEANKWWWACPIPMVVFLSLFSCLPLAKILFKNSTIKKKWGITSKKIFQTSFSSYQILLSKFFQILWEFLEPSIAKIGHIRTNVWLWEMQPILFCLFIVKRWTLDIMTVMC